MLEWYYAMVGLHPRWCQASSGSSTPESASDVSLFTLVSPSPSHLPVVVVVVAVFFCLGCFFGSGFVCVCFPGFCKCLGVFCSFLRKF